MKENVSVRTTEERVTYDALHDGLTGLPNRQLFLDRLGLSFDRAKKHDDTLFGIIFLDIDRFRSVNESYGHVIGDDLLVALVQSISPHLRVSDSFARLGSDEFAVLLEDLRTPRRWPRSVSTHPDRARNVVPHRRPRHLYFQHHGTRFLWCAV